MLYVFCDGSITGSHWAKKSERDSPAFGWSGWVVQDESGVIHHHSMALGTHPLMSANVAEYMAVRSALYWLGSRHFRDETVLVHSDSQLVMRQLSGEYQIHNERLKRFHKDVKSLEKVFPKVIYRWIPREQNRYADFMSKCLQTEYGGVIPPVPLSPDLYQKPGAGRSKPIPTR